MRAGHVIILISLLAVLAAPLATAQTVISPPQGTFQENYIVSGRIVDSAGVGASGARIEVGITQQGTRAEPVVATANCKGDFIVPFRGLYNVRGAGSATVKVFAGEGRVEHNVNAPLDPFYRRTDITVHLPYGWGAECDPEKNPAWTTLISVSGRVVNRTEPYEAHGVTYDAQPYLGPLAVRWIDPTGNALCPISQGGLCEALYTDERGDFRYTWTFSKEVEAGGHVEVAVGGRSYNVSVDPSSRLAVHHIEVSGRGPPPAETPGVPLAASLVVIGLVGLAARRLLPERPR